MPHFTLPVVAGGPLVVAYIAPSAARVQALKDAGQPIPTPVQIDALVDTGASCTCIDPEKLLALGLSPTGTANVNTPSTGKTPKAFSQYDVGLVIPGADKSHATLTFPTIPVVATPLSSQGIDALIGRDILGDCILNYNGTMGFFTLAY